MFEKFEFKTLRLESIYLDPRNPRIVTQKQLTTEDEIIAYLYEHEGLAEFVKKIAHEGKNPGAERPYVVRSGKDYVVVEGNTRIAAYKILTGLATPPAGSPHVPHISQTAKDGLSLVDCSIAPDYETLMPIMANAHFGQGDKSKWGYLGSRKAVWDKWKEKLSPAELAKIFNQTPAEIVQYLLEYKLYLEALKLTWSKSEKSVLTKPSVMFNPPVRFLESQGHKDKVGVALDKTNIRVNFANPEARNKFKHLVMKLVINPQRGLGATASYDDVFKDYGPGASSSTAGTGKSGAASSSTSASSGNASSSATSKAKGKSSKAQLFPYDGPPKNLVLKQLCEEAKTLNIIKYPSCGTFLLRNLLETLLKAIISKSNANPKGNSLSLEQCISLCLSNAVSLPKDHVKLLKEFSKQHLDYVNLGAHGNTVANYNRLVSARDSVDVFVRENLN
jgi:hypothetical protein